MTSVRGSFEAEKIQDKCVMNGYNKKKTLDNS